MIPALDVGFFEETMDENILACRLDVGLLLFLMGLLLIFVLRCKNAQTRVQTEKGEKFTPLIYGF